MKYFPAEFRGLSRPPKHPWQNNNVLVSIFIQGSCLYNSVWWSLFVLNSFFHNPWLTCLSYPSYTLHTEPLHLTIHSFPRLSDKTVLEYQNIFKRGSLCCHPSPLQLITITRLSLRSIKLHFSPGGRDGRRPRLLLPTLPSSWCVGNGIIFLSLEFLKLSRESIIMMENLLCYLLTCHILKISENENTTSGQYGNVLPSYSSTHDLPTKNLCRCFVHIILC